MLGAAIWLGVTGWPAPNRTLELGGFVLAAVIAASLAPQRHAARDWTIAPPSFVIEIAALLLLGPEAMLVVAVAGVVMYGLTEAPRPDRVRDALIHATTGIVAAVAAGVAHQRSGGTIDSFLWPEQALPVTVAAVAYCLVKSVSLDLAAPLLTKERVDRSWTTRLVDGLPNYVIGTALAAAAVTVIEERWWNVALVAAVPAYFAYRAYEGYVSRLVEERRRVEVGAYGDHGMCIVDTASRVMLWDAGLERILDCPRERALGHSIGAAVPALARTELPRLIEDTLKGTTGGAAQVQLSAATGVRTIHVKALPAAGGAAVIWEDLTRRMRADQALERREERLSLAAEGASDGLWEWDSRSQEFYCSNRWRAMLGLPARNGVGHISEWFDRVHDEDRAALKEAFESHVSGGADHFQHAHRVRHEDGTYRQVLCRGIAARGPSRRLRLAGSMTEIATPRPESDQANNAAFTDPLTGLGNRTIFVERLGRRLEVFKQGRCIGPFAALYLDLDRFKIVNDNLGHLVGDQLLTAVSRRLETCIRSGDELARLGGDEFAILLNDLGDANQANAVAFRIQETLSSPFSIGGREVFTSASIGIAIGNGQYNSPDEIMRDADTAMYQAKSHGKARHELFDAAMHARELDRLGLETDLRHAVNTNGFEVHYQPIVLLSTGMCVGFESLARWTRNGQPVSPVTFIPLAEELGIIEPLGTWMLQEACNTFADWKRRFPESGLDFITVNVSSRQLMQRNFLRVVEKAIEKSGITPCDLRLEITETALMDNPGEAAALLADLRGFGTKIYLDDFGCGYSSLSHLAKLPVDVLKIDRSFVKNLLLPERPAIVESILALARTLNTGVVAEGIEHETQSRELARLGCTHAQGFLFSRPLSAACAEQIIAANVPLGPARTEPGTVPPEHSVENGLRQFQWPENVLTRQ